MGMCIINTNESSEFLGELGSLPYRVDSYVDSTETRIWFFFQQKPGAMLMLKLILPNEWGFLGSPQCPVEVLVLLIVGKRDTNRK